MNVWGFPKIIERGLFFFFKVSYLKNCENNSREALFFFFLVTY